jgi:hypothetical protein
VENLLSCVISRSDLPAESREFSNVAFVVSDLTKVQTPSDFAQFLVSSILSFMSNTTRFQAQVFEDIVKFSA